MFFSSFAMELEPEWKAANKTAETDARATRTGLWQVEGAVPPWSWRKQRRNEKVAAVEQHKETLEGISQELAINSKILGNKLRDFKQQFNSEKDTPEDDQSDQTQIQKKDRLSCWEIFAKLGEGASHWIKAFFS